MIVAHLMGNVMERMRDSGYGERFRQEILESILKGWEKMLIEHRAGRRPINRKRTWREEE